MGHIFISYSHKDTDYAHGLANNLQSMGFEVWIDARLDYGAQWPHEIQKRLDACDVFILIMSPRSFASEWVQSELQRAKRKLKPIFPLLLEGDEPWLSVESTQFFDVRGGRFPDDKFYSALKRVVAISQNTQTLQFSNHPVKTDFVAAPSVPQNRKGVVITILVAMMVVFVVCAGAFVVLFRGGLFSVPTVSSLLPVTATLNSSLVTSPPLASSTLQSTETLVPTLPPTESPTVISLPAEITDLKGVPMRLVLASEFTMGNDNGNPAERPAHKVYLDNYYIDKYEVTNAAYKHCVDVGKCDPPKQSSSYTRDSYYGNSQFDDYPVIYVDWNMAENYCEWRDGNLPTEAQWEKAARGIDGRTYPWGEDIICDKLNYNGCKGDTTKVGSYLNGVSPYGLYDMAGNVWEWIADWYSETYYQNSSSENPMGPDSGESRVLRGGSWGSGENLLHASIRGSYAPDSPNLDIGFRCVRSLP